MFGKLPRGRLPGGSGRLPGGADRLPGGGRARLGLLGGGGWRPPTELIINGTFDANTTGWTASRSSTLSWNSGRLRVTNGASQSSGTADQALTLVVGKTYSYSVTMPAAASTTGRLRIGSGAGLTGTPVFETDMLAAGQTLTGTFIAETATTYVTVGVRGGTVSVSWCEFDDISVSF